MAPAKTGRDSRSRITVNKRECGNRGMKVREWPDARKENDGYNKVDRAKNRRKAS